MEKGKPTFDRNRRNQNRKGMGMKENQDFLTKQIITYIGNKRLLLPHIEREVEIIRRHLKKEKMICADLFAGSGIVGRMLKKHASLLYVNDLEEYSYVVNSCYLSNKEDFPEKDYHRYRRQLQERLKAPKMDGVIFRNYAPKNLANILEGERVFYTPENAQRIDTARDFIAELPPELQKYFLAPLLYEASVHVNTGGVFKGFYKDSRTGKGRFGGTAENALPRILGRIEILPPVFSNFRSGLQISRGDANQEISRLPEMDILYLDPPYNQHPYGSNYFMLNVIAANQLNAPISKVSGIPDNWNRSAYNSKKTAAFALRAIAEQARARFLIVSYNSEGFIGREEMQELLGSFGKVKTVEMEYNAYRASRNLSNRSVHVREYLFVLKKA